MGHSISLAAAFGLAQERVVALTGAGGKTSALFRLARASGPAALVTNTAHLAVEQGRFADRVFRAERPGDLPAFETGLPDGVTLITGPADARGRTQGLKDALLERVHELAVRSNAPLFIEADGSRGRPLKAPADWEPPIPLIAGCVITCAGLSGLGKPLSEEWVYRPEDFSRLSGIPLGEAVSAAGLERVLLHPMGGLKNIPPGARRLALLNQADSAGLQASAGGLARHLTIEFERVVVASLRGPGEPGTEPQVHAVYRPIAGVILAAGAAVRMGHPKQLLDWQGEPLVRRAARTALEAGLSPVVVVGGAYQAELESALAGLNLRVVNNPDWREGQSSSVRAGLLGLPAQTGGAVFLLADQPFASAGLIEALIRCHAETQCPAAAPVSGGRRANPVLFDRCTFDDLSALRGEAGGRQILGKWGFQAVDWPDERILLDIDDPEDYRRAVEAAGER